MSKKVEYKDFKILKEELKKEIKSELLQDKKFIEKVKKLIEKKELP